MSIFDEQNWAVSVSAISVSELVKNCSALSLLPETVQGTTEASGDVIVGYAAFREAMDVPRVTSFAVSSNGFTVPAVIGVGKLATAFISPGTYR